MRQEPRPRRTVYSLICFGHSKPHTGFVVIRGHEAKIRRPLEVLRGKQRFICASKSDLQFLLRSRSGRAGVPKLRKNIANSRSPFFILAHSFENMALTFEQETEQLKQKLLRMAKQAAGSVNRAIQSLLERNGGLALKVKEEDSILDSFEIEVDDLAIHLLAQAPLPSDLRFITIAMKISHDLERVGDEATTISRRSYDLNKEPQLKPYVDIPRMANLALDMLNQAMESFVRGDPEQARSIIPRDKDVDALNKQLHRELASFMVESRDNIPRCLNLMVISKSIERIADHATNIAEEVVYLLEGKDIRHLPELKR
jgi:phosphate transport system protein